MKKVLVIITTAFVPYGGLTTVMMNYYRTMNFREFQIDFASTNIPPKDLIKELNNGGSSYYNLGNRKNIPKYLFNLFKLIKENHYDIVHVNGNSASMAMDLTPAVVLKIPYKIAHVHSSASDYPIINAFLLPIFKLLYNCAIAASNEAGEWLFQSDYIILNNAIELNNYRYSKLLREKKRKSFHIENKVVIGTVGKLTKNKNHIFLIKIFAEINKYINNAILLIVGDGPLRLQLEEMCMELKLNNVVFLGMRTDINQLLQTFDYFVFPSKHEGFGMALLEAQASGLMCVASTSIPSSVNVSGNVKFLNLYDNPKIWADYIIQTLTYDRVTESNRAFKLISDRGFNIQYEGKKLMDIYKQVQ